MRNLVINPSGEATTYGSWFGSQGDLTYQATDRTALYAEGFVKYVATTLSAGGNWVTFRGNLDPPAQGMYAIADTSGGAACRVSVSAPEATYVSLYVQYMMQNDLTTETTEISYTTLSREFIAGPVSIAANADNWTAIEGSGVDIPTNATHWYPMVMLSGPTANTSPPGTGTFYIDGAFVPDTGDLAAVAYFDGDMLGYHWEGQAHASASATGAPAEGLIQVTFPPQTDEEIARAAISRRRDGDLCVAGDVMINGLTLNYIDSYGVLWVLSDLEGWWTTPDNDVPDIDRGWADGSYETRGRYQARVITMTGSFFPPAPGEVAPARDRLLRAVSLVHQPGWFMTRELDVIKGARVVASGQPSISTVNTVGRTDFSIGLRAPDPLKYSIRNGDPPGYDSMTITTRSQVVLGRTYPRVFNQVYPGANLGPSDAFVTNYGNFNSPPLLTVNGPAPGPCYIINSTTEQTMTVTKPLLAGEVLSIDCGTRQVSLNGGLNKRSYLDLFTDWIELAPGPNRIYFEDAGGSTATLTIEWRSSWIG